MILKATNESLELITSSTASIDVSVSFSELNLTTSTPDGQETKITTATTTAILTAPITGNQRFVLELSIKNSGTVANTIILQKKIGAVIYEKLKVNLNPHETLIYTKDTGFKVLTSSGAEKKEYNPSSIITAKTYNVLKVGAGTEAAGLVHSLALTSGLPGAWTIGTPGLIGRAMTSELGSIPISNALTGTNYLTTGVATASGSCTPLLTDFLWVNSGLVVTTTAAQTINSVAFPPRDDNYSSNGQGINIGILVATATTNAAAIANITMSYTNSAGVAGRTATMSAFPATAVAGTFIPFQMSAGDNGVQSIQSITLGTTLGAGAISLVAFKNYVMMPGFVTNGGGQIDPRFYNIKLPNNICLFAHYVATGTGATVLQYSINIEEK